MTLIDEGKNTSTNTQPNTAAASGAPAAQGGGSPDPGAPSPSWRDSLPEEMRKEPSLATFQDVGALAKSYLHAQSSLSKKGVVVPGEKDDDAAWGNFFKAAGLPDLDKYELSAPKDVKVNEEFLKSFKEVFHKTGVLPRQAQKIVEAYIQHEQAVMKKSHDTQAEKAKTARFEMERELGPAFHKEMAYARIAAKEIGDDFVKFIKESGLGDEPQIVKALSKFGKMYGEDRLRGEMGGGSFGKTMAEIDQEIQQIESSPDYFNTESPNYKALNQKRENLYRLKYPAQAG